SQGRRLGLLTDSQTSLRSSRRATRGRQRQLAPAKDAAGVSLPSRLAMPCARPDFEGGDMAENRLQGKRIAITAADMVERVELVEPRKALEEAGAKTDLISIHPGEIRSFNHFDPADTFPVDRLADEVDVSEYDALMIPGGVGNPDQLRGDENVVSFVRDFFEAGKPVAAICHGPWVLVEADVVRGRTLTSWPTLQTDIRNAGGNWVDREVDVDQGLVTSRKPDDIPAFNAKMIEEFAEGTHAGQRRKTETAP